MERRLTDFQGRWHLSRQIDDAKAGVSGKFEGVAVLVPDGVGLRYEEAGELRMPAGTMRATRRYLWRQDGAEIVVLFDDGRDFHRIGAGGAVTAFHFCAPDSYEVSYNFGRWPHWRATWRVTGPRKDYVMTTDFRPAAGPFVGPAQGD